MPVSKNRDLIEAIYNYLVILLFFSAILVPAIGHLGGWFDNGYIRVTEKRIPNVKPDFPDSFETLRSYPSKLNEFINDTFGFRSWLVSMNSRLMLALGASPSEKVISGKDGWLFFSDEDMVKQYRGISLYTDAERDRWIAAMEERKEWLAQKGIPFIIAVPPNKMTIYPEYLPDWITRVSLVNRIDQLVSVMDQSDLDFIDLRQPVLEGKKNNPVYHMTDSHWNFHGGFIGYLEIMKKVKAYYPDVVVLSPGDVDIVSRKSIGMDLCNMLNISKYKKEPYADHVVLKNPSKVITARQTGSGYFPRTVSSEIPGSPRVLIFCDSYTINMEPFFNETFRDILYTRHDNMKFNAALVDEYQPDLVLQIMIERALRYRPFNPPGVGDDRLRIANWGPVSVQAGKKFNVQSNNQSAFWIIGENISKDTVIIWNNHRLKTAVNMDQSVLSALVPDELYSTPDQYEIKLYSPVRNEFSGSVFFAVTD